MRRTWIALALTVAFLGILLSQTNLHAIVASFSGLSPLAAVAGLLVWALLNSLRARRFSILVHSREISPARMFSIVNMQNFLATITPGRAGDLAYVLLLRQEGRVPGAEGLAGLIVARAMDFVVSFGAALAALLGVRKALPPGSDGVVLSTAALFGAALVIALQITRVSGTGMRVMEAALRWTPLGKSGLARRVMAKAGEVHAQIVRAQASDRGPWRLWALTAAIWAASYAVSWIWIRGLGLPLSFGQAMFAAAVAGLAVSLPVQGLAGLGTTEAGWAIPLVLMGVQRQEAIAAGFCFHALAIIYLVILGGSGFLHLSFRRRMLTVPVDK
jgi:uncharacterized protein (TIRG00374 family)